MGWQITFDGTRREVTAEEREHDEYVSSWEGGKVVDLDDLSPDVYDKIAENDPNDTWWSIYKFPGATSARLYAVVCAAAEFAGVEPPSKPANMRESKLLLQLLELTQEIEDRPTMNGFPQTPSETATGSSSGPSDASDGDLPK